MFGTEKSFIEGIKKLKNIDELIDVREEIFNRKDFSKLNSLYNKVNHLINRFENRLNFKINKNLLRIIQKKYDCMVIYSLFKNIKKYNESLNNYRANGGITPFPMYPLISSTTDTPFGYEREPNHIWTKYISELKHLDPLKVKRLHNLKIDSIKKNKKNYDLCSLCGTDIYYGEGHHMPNPWLGDRICDDEDCFQMGAAYYVSKTRHQERISQIISETFSTILTVDKEEVKDNYEKLLRNSGVKDEKFIREAMKNKFGKD